VGQKCERGGCKRKGEYTFITGAQKCTVFNPIGLSHMRFKNPTSAFGASGAAVLWYLLPPNLLLNADSDLNVKPVERVDCVNRD
jgi:hypothetical protein